MKFIADIVFKYNNLDKWVLNIDINTEDYYLYNKSNNTTIKAKSISYIREQQYYLKKLKDIFILCIYLDDGIRYFKIDQIDETNYIAYEINSKEVIERLVYCFKEQ